MNYIPLNQRSGAMSIFSNLVDWFDELREEGIYQKGYEKGEAAANAENEDKVFEDGFYDGYYSNKD
jgi:hypothetical protein